MNDTVSLKENRQFRRLYAKGKSVVGPCFVLYCRKNRLENNRLGITVGGKLGNAVTRNRIRRRMREIYRIHESEFSTGFDLVAVARVRALHTDFAKLEREFLAHMDKLGLLKRDAG